MLYVVTGEGPNGLQIPLVIFLVKEEAEQFIDQFPKHKEVKGWLDGDFSDRTGIYTTEAYEDSEIGKPLYEALFKNGNYYSGCGGCYKLVILEVEPRQPMVGWDLD